VIVNGDSDTQDGRVTRPAEGSPGRALAFSLRRVVRRKSAGKQMARAKGGAGPWFGSTRKTRAGFPRATGGVFLGFPVPAVFTAPGGVQAGLALPGPGGRRGKTTQRGGRRERYEKGCYMLLRGPGNGPRRGRDLRTRFREKKTVRFTLLIPISVHPRTLAKNLAF